jgi:hypothetical protein
MRCTRVEKFLPLYAGGDLAGRRAARRVENHLATCESCRAAAADYDASRNLVRAATLPPDFDGAFYEEIRRSVLAEIKRERPRPTPPIFDGFAALFNARMVYAASLALVVATVAALSLYSFVGRKSKDDAHMQNMIADATRERSAQTAATATPDSTQAKGDERQTLSPFKEMTRGTGSRGPQVTSQATSQVPKSPSTRRHANNDNTQTASQRSVDSAKRTASYAKRNPLAPNISATVENTEEIARRSSGDETDAAPEVSRIEIQTSDPNIRIIWLSPKPDASAQPLK